MKIDLQQIIDSSVRPVIRQIADVLNKLDREKVNKKDVHQRFIHTEGEVNQAVIDRGYIVLKHVPIDESLMLWIDGAIQSKSAYNVDGKRLYLNMTLTLGLSSRIQYSYIGEK